MGNIVKFIFIIVGIFMCCNFLLTSRPAFAESITLTTYYPSPYGSYNELSTAGNTYLATDGGRVGIGTTAPNGFYKVHVFGDPLAGIYSESQTSYGVVGSSGSNYGVVGQSLSNDGVRGTSGNGRGVYGQSLNNIGGYFEALNVNGVALATGGGYVGVGISNPPAPLSVNGDVNIGMLGQGVSAYDNSLDPGHQNPGLVVRARQGVSGGGDIILTDWPGEIDAGDIVFTDGNGNQLSRIWSDEASGEKLNLTAHSNDGAPNFTPTPDLSINGIGDVYINHNVGIGTPSPQNALHLAGSSPWIQLQFVPWGVYSPATMSVGAANGSGRILCDNNLAIFLDYNNDSTTATFSILHDNLAFLPPVENLLLLDESGTMTMKGGGSYNATTVQWLPVSDIAHKKNIIDLRYGLKDVLRLQPREFDLKTSGVHQIGFVAQEIEKVIPELVSGKDGAKGLEYGNITAVLVNAIKEQQKQLEGQQKQIEGLKAEIEKMKAH